MTTQSFSSTAAAVADDDLGVPSAPTSNHPHTVLPNAQASIIYTETDEAPALATYSLFPVVNKIGALADIDIIPCDISVSGRVLALFPEKLQPDQRVPDNLAYLGKIAKTPEANIIKLPNSECKKLLCDLFRMAFVASRNNFPRSCLYSVSEHSFSFS
jgi:hypothetical protein